MDKKKDKYAGKSVVVQCPTCGEEGSENWIVRGIDDWNKRKILY